MTLFAVSRIHAASITRWFVAIDCIPTLRSPGANASCSHLCFAFGGFRKNTRHHRATSIGWWTDSSTPSPPHLISSHPSPAQQPSSSFPQSRFSVRASGRRYGYSAQRVPQGLRHSFCLPICDRECAEDFRIPSSSWT